MNENLPNAAPSGEPVTIRCDDVESLAVLYSCDELEPAARAALETHAAGCAACSAILAREARFNQVIAALEQPADALDRSGLLLAQSRSRLSEALDDMEAKRNAPGWRALVSPSPWWTGLRNTLVYHPAMSMATLVVVGFFAGVLGQRFQNAPLPVPVAVTAPKTQTTTAVVTPPPTRETFPVHKVTDEQLRSAESANVAWVNPEGSRTPTVQVQLMSPTPMSIVGAPDDEDVMRALTFVLQNGARFDSGARLDSVGVLGTRAADESVRRALCSAARVDANPAVRIKAFETLQGFEPDPLVRQTILEALETDSDSDVRVEAIHLLVNALQMENASGYSDPQLVSALRSRLHNDSSELVRRQSAAALRAVGADARP